MQVFAAGSAGMMTGLLNRMGQGGACRAEICGGARPTDGVATFPVICVAYMAEPVGAVSPAGELLLAAGVESVVLATATPTWARVLNGNGELLFTCGARLSTAPDMGEVLVVAAPAGLYVGALVQVVSGALSGLPAP